ncbi:FAD binding domain-containing protein [Allohahella marinimesophila]|uniref:FAD binding domain-containing protein n=1 Tax=Allohahella marinimesophila TaxID=1054972 RepID=A0ABP7NWH2_9GAMM
MKAHAFDYQIASTVESACAALQGDVRLVAGAQSLGPMLNLRLARPDMLLDISRLPALRTFQATAEGLIIGAAITTAEIEDGLLPDTTNGILPRIASGIAYRSVRNRGTIGGSIAHADPSADWCTTLSVLNAEVILQSRSSPAGFMSKERPSRRRMPVNAFLTGAFTTRLAKDELIVAIYIPRVDAATRFGYFKLCSKTGELAHAMSAVLVCASGEQRAVIGALPGSPIMLEGSSAFDEKVWRQRLSQAAPQMPPQTLRTHLHVLQRAMSDSTQTYGAKHRGS